jgi:nucleotide-binding universal stress UspA family protein
MFSPCSPETKEPLKIILADDGSKHAQAAIQTLNKLPFEKGTSILVVGVVPPIQATSHVIWQQRLENTKIMLKRDGIVVSTELIAGYPAETLLRIGERERPDLMVLGAKGLRATLGILLGGVAQQIVEYGSWPTLVVRHPYQEIHKILLASDGSPSSKCAENFLKRLRLAIDSEITVMNILPPEEHLTPESENLEQALQVSESSRELLTMDSIPDAVKKILEETCANLSAVYPATHCLLRKGDAATELLDFAQKEKINLIVAGSRGLSPVSAWLLGSVSRKLVHYATCSVLLVKGDIQ